MNSPAPPTRGAVLPSLYVSLIGLEAYDGYSTTRGLKHGAIESNAFMRRLAANPSALWAVKGGATFVSIYMAERLLEKTVFMTGDGRSSAVRAEIERAGIQVLRKPFAIDALLGVATGILTSRA